MDISRRRLSSDVFVNQLSEAILSSDLVMPFDICLENASAVGAGGVNRAEMHNLGTNCERLVPGILRKFSSADFFAVD